MEAKLLSRHFEKYSKNIAWNERKQKARRAGYHASINHWSLQSVDGAHYKTLQYHKIFIDEIY